MKIEREILKPTPGMAREIGFYLSGIEETRAELRVAVADLTNEELGRRVTPKAHQIGNLILHIGEAEASWIHSRVAGRELSEEEKRFAHWCDTTETDYAEKNYTAQECVERIDEISRRSRQILAEFSDEDIEKIFILDREKGRLEISLRSILRHLADHEATHKGQILMLKRILRDG
jgi:uncharacterized damage-inducible protein DinB